MLTIPSAFQDHLEGDVTTLTMCWTITRHDDEVVRATAHDRDITISTGPYAGTYKKRAAFFATDVESKSDGSVSNADTEGAFRVDAETTDDIKVEEIEGGLFDQAKAVLFMLNWQAPDDGQKVLLAGTLGEFERDSDGRYRSEVRGLTQALSQQIVRTYSGMCNVSVFGDERCKFDVESKTRTGTVTAVESRKRFSVQLDPGPDPVTANYYDGARLEFTSGDNDNAIREVRAALLDTDYDTAEILLWDEAPSDIEVDDTINLPPACDKQYQTCRLVHQNLVNFRGYGLFAAGRDALTRGPLGFTRPRTELTLAELEQIHDDHNERKKTLF